jgi:predicted amidohydrolase
MIWKLSLVALALSLLSLGCSKTEPEEPDLAIDDAAVDDLALPPGDGAPPKQDLGPNPKKDLGPNPKQDLGPNPKKDLGPNPKQDLGLPPKPDLSQPKKDQGLPAGDLFPTLPDFGTPPASTKVAAIQYAKGQASLVKPACASDPKPDVCALRELVIQARAGGASLVVTPEWVLSGVAEPDPVVGDNPALSASWPGSATTKQFSFLAKQLAMTVVLSHFTFTGPSGSETFYNSQVAFGPSGAVLAVHHKFNLFGNEPKTFTAGTEVEVFQHPLGTVGLLVCADIYGSTTLLTKLASTLKARVVAVSSYWTVSSPITGWYIPYAKKYGVYTIVANTTDAPGYGGAIISPTGAVIAQVSKTTPSVLFGTIPLP